MIDQRYDNARVNKIQKLGLSVHHLYKIEHVEKEPLNHNINRHKQFVGDVKSLVNFHGKPMNPIKDWVSFYDISRVIERSDGKKLSRAINFICYESTKEFLENCTTTVCYDYLSITNKKETVETLQLPLNTYNYYMIETITSHFILHFTLGEKDINYKMSEVYLKTVLT